MSGDSPLPYSQDTISWTLFRYSWNPSFWAVFLVFFFCAKSCNRAGKKKKGQSCIFFDTFRPFFPIFDRGKFSMFLPMLSFGPFSVVCQACTIANQELTLIFLCVFYLEKARKTTKKARILYPWQTPKIRGKEGKTLQK